MCSSCTKNRAALIAQRNQAKRNSGMSVNTLENIVFHELYYVGQTETEIPSVIPNVSYGIRAFGTLMYVADADYQLHNDWWADENPINSDNL